MNDHYVYMYLRERKTENGLPGTPYYVGKGHGQRAFNRRKNVHLPSRLVNIVLVATGLPEREALALERAKILEYGRLDLGTGCLMNRTIGGEFRHTPEARAKITASLMGHKRQVGRKQSDEEKRRKSEALKGRAKPPRSDEHRRKLGLVRKGIKQSAELIEKRIAPMRGRKRPPFSDEWKARLKEAARRRWQSSG